jgi:hypothetical protein
MPELAKFQKSHPHVPVFLASADNENDLPEVQKFLMTAGINFPSRLIKAPQEDFIETWRTRSSLDPSKRWSLSLPVTFFLSVDGAVIKFLSAETNAVELGAISSQLLLNSTNPNNSPQQRPHGI